MVLKYGTPSTVTILSILKQEQSQDDCLLSSLLVSLAFIKMFGIVTCTLAASNFLYYDFEEETSVAALGMVPPPAVRAGTGEQQGTCHVNLALLLLACSPQSPLFTL